MSSDLSTFSWRSICGQSRKCLNGSNICIMWICLLRYTLSSARLTSRFQDSWLCGRHWIGWPKPFSTRTAKHITTHSAMRGLFFYKEILAQPSIELIEPSRPTGIRHGHGGGREWHQPIDQIKVYDGTVLPIYKNWSVHKEIGSIFNGFFLIHPGLRHFLATSDKLAVSSIPGRGSSSLKICCCMRGTSP